MGAKPSSLSDLQHNPVLQRFTGHTCVGEDKEFWEELLSFSFSAPYNRLALQKRMQLLTLILPPSLKNFNLQSLVIWYNQISVDDIAFIALD